MEEAQLPRDLEELIARIGLLKDTLPKRLRQCADYIVQNTDEIAFSTVAEISERAQVQPSAIMRFCQVIGFSGYSDMQKLARQTIHPKMPDYSERIQNLRDSGDDSPAPVAKGKSKAAVSVDEMPSMEAKQKERDALQRAMDEFLSKGGRVQEVEANVVADPPKKPDNKYGSRPI